MLLSFAFIDTVVGAELVLFRCAANNS